MMRLGQKRGWSGQAGPRLKKQMLKKQMLKNQMLR
jgi:hypothetical protein